MPKPQSRLFLSTLGGRSTSFSLAPFYFSHRGCSNLQWRHFKTRLLLRMDPQSEQRQSLLPLKRATAAFLTLQIKNKKHLLNLLLPCLEYFLFTNKIWWANKIRSYIVKYFFHLFFYYMCNIFVLILYIKNKQGVPFLFVRFFPCRVIYLFVFFLVFSTPSSESFLGKFKCLAVLVVLRERGTGSEFSGMSSRWFFACNVIDVRLSSAHCITNQCYHSRV